MRKIVIKDEVPELCSDDLKRKNENDCKYYGRLICDFFDATLEYRYLGGGKGEVIPCKECLKATLDEEKGK